MASERYSRQVILEGFGEEAQQRLAQAKVLVIGAGGLGCPILQYLAAAGVGHLGIADGDTVSVSNLHRQVLFTTEEVGKLKVHVARKRLVAMNPEITVRTYPVQLQQHNILDIIGPYDIIMDGTDNFESRYLINDACALLDKPLVFAAVSEYEGQLCIFSRADQTGVRCNYRDLFPAAPAPGEIGNCADNGVLGVVPGLIGSMAATEAIKLISGLGKPLINQLLHYNVLQMAQYEIQITPGTGYRLPATKAEFLTMNYNNTPASRRSYTEIDTTQLTDLKNEPATLLIDVRERHEYPQLNDEVYTKVPMSELAAFLEQPLEAENLVFICQHGIRSAAAAEAFHDKYGAGKKIYSLKGGIAKWRTYFLNT